MVDAFIGSRVSLLLADGSMQGVFSDFDPARKKLTLNDVTLVRNDGTTAHLTLFSIPASKILDLNIVSEGRPRGGRTSSGPGQHSTPLTGLPKSTPVQPLENHSALLRDPAIVSFRPPAPISSTESSAAAPFENPYVHTYPKHDRDLTTTLHKNYSAGNTHTASTLPREPSRTASDSSTGHEKIQTRKSRKQYGSKGKPSPGKRGPPERHNEWADNDVSHFIEEEFDFQRNLGLFDKARIFAEIKETDHTAPEARLVHHNRLQQNWERQSASQVAALESDLADTRLETRGDDAALNSRSGRRKRQVKQRNLAPTENVLEQGRRSYLGVEGDASVSGSEESDDEESDITVNGKQVPRSPAAGRKVRLRTLAGVQCPVVTMVQMLEAERVAITDTGPNEDQMAENAGRSVCQLVLKVLGGNRRINVKNHNAAPVVVVLCGNNKIGSYAAAAARHLANHGCQVLACIAGSTLVKSLADQRRIFLPTGGLLYNSANELPGPQDPPVDLIVDGLLGSQYALKDIAHQEDRGAIRQLIVWANANKAPVVSLDLPSGAKRPSGALGPHGKSPLRPCIEPKITLCLGAPKADLTDRAANGEVYLADVGIPCVAWKQAGVRNWSPAMFGAEYVVGLEYYNG